MGDGQQPHFLGGLPPRVAAATETTSTAPAPEQTLGQPEGWKRHKLPLIVGGAILIALFAGLAIFLSVLGNATEQQETAHVPIESGYVATPEEAAAAEAAIAEGGGAVDGHIVSGELCTALDGFAALSSEAVSSTDVSPEMLAAMEALATVESPNQADYKGFLDLVKDPGSVTSIADAQALSTDFVKATQVDTVTCM